jgi:hypothetical protein
MKKLEKNRFAQYIIGENGMNTLKAGANGDVNTTHIVTEDTKNGQDTSTATWTCCCDKAASTPK